MSVTTTGETGQAPAATTGQAPAVTTGTTGSTATGTEAAKTYDETYVKKLRDEAAANRTRLKALEDAEEERAKAALSETDRLKKEATDAATRATKAENRAREALGRAAVTAAAAQAGLDADVALAMVKVEFDAEGEPTGVDAAVAKLAKDKPHLVLANQGGGTGSPANPQRGASGVVPDLATIPRLGERGLFKTGTG